MKKIFIVTMLFGAISLNVSAQFAGGTGTASDPYLIETAEQLQNVSKSATSCFLLKKDIDLSTGVWTPIATFTGTFDGGNHVISGLDMEGGSDGSGLFARLNTPGVIENVIMRDCIVVGNNWSGILCSTNGNYETKGGTIRNCTIYDSSIDGAESVGAFAGVSAGSFENCRAFNVKVDASGDRAGGIAGMLESTGGHFYDCVFYGDVNGAATVGGICSYYNAKSDDDITFKNNVVYGNISSSTGTVGGIMAKPEWYVENVKIDNCAIFANISGQCIGSVGGNALRGSVTNCYGTGTLKCTGVWKNGDWNDPWNGGICAVNFNGPVQDCYFSGSITTGVADAKIAGVCGRNWPGITVKNCYYNSDGAPQGMGDGDNPALYDAKTLLPEQMTKLSNFAFSDMTRWQIVDGETTPFLANQTAPLKITKCTTANISGTGESDLEYVYLLGSMSESIRKNVTVNNGSWSVDLVSGDVLDQETITAIGFGKDKMPSMIVKAKVVADATGINNVNSDDNQSKPAAIYNIAGQRINSIQKGEINIVKYSNGKVAKIKK
jgi:hypothetical protein